MTGDQLKQLLNGTRFGDGFSPGLLEHLAGHARPGDFPGGMMLFREGDVGDACYVIIDGTIDISVNSLVISTLGRNQIIGEIAVFGHEPRTATVTATTRLEVLRFSGDLYRSVVRENADAAVEMCRILAERLANTTLKLQQVSNPGAK